MVGVWAPEHVTVGAAPSPAAPTKKIIPLLQTIFHIVRFCRPSNLGPKIMSYSAFYPANSTHFITPPKQDITYYYPSHIIIHSEDILRYKHMKMKVYPTHRFLSLRVSFPFSLYYSKLASGLYIL